MEPKIIASKVLKLQENDDPYGLLNFYQNEKGFVVVKMEKLGNCLWFHLVRYED